MEELLKKLNRNNDDIVFEEIINKVQKQLFIIAKARLRDDSLAEDALQETFISLYLNINKIKDEKKLKAWLTKTLINKCNDIMRKNKIYSFKCDYNILENNLYSNNQYDDLNNHIDIFRIINLLNVEERTIIIMFYSKKYTIKEISKILNINENTIKTKISRIKIKLKKYIEE